MTNREAVILLRKANKILRKHTEEEIQIFAQEINNTGQDSTETWTDLEILIWHFKNLPKEELIK